LSDWHWAALHKRALPFWRARAAPTVPIMLSEASGAVLRWWRAIGLASQFALAAALVIGTSMAVLGSWVAARIEKGVVEHAATNATLHLDSFVEPQLQTLVDGHQLSDEAERRLSALALRNNDGNSILSITIWGADGMIIFSTIPRLEGQRRLMPAKVSRAWLGQVEDKFEMVRPEDGAGGGAAEPVLKIFAPIHHTGTARIIAVAEVHESAAQLQKDIARTRWQTGGVMALLSLAMLTTLSGIVRRGGQTITSQQKILSERVGELSSALARNEELQDRVLEANRRSTDTNDRFLRRIGAELHDGPVQLIALALLRLEGLKPTGSPTAATPGNSEDFAAVESALRDALKEIRGMSSGLSLPKMEGSTISQVIDYAVKNHERRSRTRVALEFGADLPKHTSPLLLTCLYRAVQEGLNNAVRHAGGKDQLVRIGVEGTHLVLEIADGGPGISEQPAVAVDDTKGLGLKGLMDRVESLDGTFEVVSDPGQGTKLRIRFDKAALERFDEREV
jgi:signal transduction histidine kinase